MKIASAQINSYLQKIAQEKISGCLIYGPEASVAKYRFDFIAKKITPDLSDPFLVSHIGKERLAEEKTILTDEFFSISMLGGRKLIIIRDADIAAGSALKNLIEDKDFFTKSDNFILILAGDLDKNSILRKTAESSPFFAAIACYEDNDQTIKSFIENELSKRNIRSNYDLIRFLAEKFGKNRQIIALEIEKIDIFLGENRELTIDLLNQLVVSQAEISVDEFVMNFAKQDFQQALLCLEKLFKDGFEVVGLIRFLSSYLQKLYLSKIELELGNMSFEEAVKMHYLFFKTEVEFKKHLKLISLDFLKENLNILAILELKVKTGIIAPRLVFTSFVSNLVKK